MFSTADSHYYLKRQTSKKETICLELQYNRKDAYSKIQCPY